MRSPLHDTCPCTPRPTSRHRAARHVDDAQAAEAALVAGEGDPIAVGRHGERALSHRPRRFGVLERLGDERGVVVPEVQPTGVVADADARAVGHVAHLLDRARPAELVADLAVERDALHSRRVPRHVRDVPRLPHQRRAARRDVGIEHEVGRPVVEPLGRTVADERPAPHLGLVDDGDHERAVVADDRRLDGVTLHRPPTRGAAFHPGRAAARDRRRRRRRRSRSNPASRRSSHPRNRARQRVAATS